MTRLRDEFEFFDGGADDDAGPAKNMVRRQRSPSASLAERRRAIALHGQTPHLKSASRSTTAMATSPSG